LFDKAKIELAPAWSKVHSKFFDQALAAFHPSIRAFNTHRVATATNPDFCASFSAFEGFGSAQTEFLVRIWGINFLCLADCLMG